MTLENAIKKAEKLSGLTVHSKGQNFWVEYKGMRVEFSANGKMEQGCGVTCIYTCKETRSDEDRMTDYWPGTFHDNITQAFKFIDKYNN
jgi:hypothetical protein